MSLIHHVGQTGLKCFPTASFDAMCTLLDYSVMQRAVTDSLGGKSVLCLHIWATVTAVIAGGGSGRVAAAIGVVRFATVDSKEAVGNAGIDGDAVVVGGDVAIERTANVVVGAVIAIIANVVNCDDGGSVAGSFHTAAMASTGGITRVC
ncbi:Hypothetical predicted protein [Octopus vulgaris]|uniref:Uncharacterized protein n=1 Tax=Octopus vulgaris TaxID=6645 RepID=A0AA36FBF2_OCTVU|nr:Hypothetical predicted protein [Octopus vulgaris]